MCPTCLVGVQVGSVSLGPVGDCFGAGDLGKLSEGGGRGMAKVTCRPGINSLLWIFSCVTLARLPI